MKVALIIIGLVLLLLAIRFGLMRGDIHACARAGWITRLRALLSKNPELITAHNHEGETPIHQAAKYGQTEALGYLIGQNGDVNAKTPQGVTPLHLAAAFGELAAVQLLLDKGAQSDPKEETGMTPMNAAQAGNHQNIIEVLTRAGANPDYVPPIGQIGEHQFVAPIAADDPLMLKAQQQAVAGLPTLRQLFKASPRDTMVKFAFKSERGQVEHLWGDLVELGDASFTARVKTKPLAANGRYQNIQEFPLSELEDWQVEQRDGTIRGGFSYQVIFYRTTQQLGALPKGLAEHKVRFVDHDIASLLAT